jgi:hypothetical protein
MVLWFKHDLRVSDHGGLDLALNVERASGAIPLFVFDTERYYDLMMQTPAAAPGELRSANASRWITYQSPLAGRMT